MGTNNSESKLDVYAKPYIPQDLIRVNSLPANIINCKPPPTVDYTAYVRSFLGSDFLSALSQPPEVPTNRPATPTNDLDPQNYSKSFRAALAREERALQNELNEYALYNVQLFPAGDPSICLFSVSVPGLRETGLRVEIGDLVYVRQLFFTPNMQLVVNSNTLDAYGQAMLLYSQHNAIVWRIDRRRELLFLRIDQLIPMSLRFNVRFTLQSHHIYATRKAIADAQEQLMTKSDWLRSMLFPSVEDGRMQKTLNAPPGSLNGERSIDAQLNYEQSRAVDTVVSKDFGPVPYVVTGPPGTGKTKVVVALALQLLQNDKGIKLLLCAPSDPASDTLVERLSKHLGIQDLLRLNSPSRSFAEVPNTILPFCHIEEEIFALPPFAEIMNKRIVVVTCRDAELLLRASLSNRDLFAFEKKMTSVFRSQDQQGGIDPPLHWNGLIIDEAAQATEPEALAPLMVVAPPKETRNKLPLVAMVGDQHQLGPRTVSKDPMVQTSLFERLLARPLYRHHPLARSNQENGVMRPLTKEMLPIIRPPFTDLIRNYRSDPAILATPSSLFYNDTLEPAVERSSPMLTWSAFRSRKVPILFSDNRSRDEIERDGGGWYNIGEAELALQYAASLVSEGLLRQEDICIMSPFRAQVNCLRARARQAARPLYDVNIGPLEAFQGLEKRFVIVCTTRTRDRFIDQDIARGLGVIHESRRFNVALTRAMEGMVVIGNPVVLVGDENWAAFIAFCKRMGAWAGDFPQDWSMPHSSKIKSSRLEKQLIWRSKVSNGDASVDKTARKLANLKFGMSEEEAFYESGVAAEQAIDGEYEDGQYEGEEHENEE